MADKKNKPVLPEKQKIFCREYIYDWNATRSYLVAYPDVKSPEVARASASRLLTNVNVQSFISEIQKNLEEIAGVSRLKVITEHMKLAFSSIAHLHNTWISRKEFESLTSEQKDCIQEIDTKIRKEWEYNPEDPDNKKPILVEYIKVKLYDKQKSLDSISKMLGYDAPLKLEIPGIQLALNVTVDKSETAETLKKLRSGIG